MPFPARARARARAVAAPERVTIDRMGLARIVGVLLIAAGVAGLVYGGFSYTKEEHQAKLGPLQFSIKEKETVAVPVWLSIGAIAAGTVLLLVNRKR